MTEQTPGPSPTVPPSSTGLRASWRRRTRELKTETYALYLACRDPRTPWYATFLAACIVAYALSPIDLIPDVIPVLGYLDDLILLPLGIALVIKLIPPPVMSDCRARAREVLAEGLPVSRTAGAVIIAIWLLLAALAILILVRVLR